MSIPISTFTSWVNDIVVNQQNMLGSWYECGLMKEYFCSFASVDNIETKLFKRRMHFICGHNKYVFKKDTYDNSEKKYVTFYLFTTDNVDSNETAERLFTHHVHHIQISTKSRNKNINTNSIKVSEICNASDNANSTASNEPSNTPSDIPTNSKWYSPEALKYFYHPIFWPVGREKQMKSVTRKTR